MTDRLTDLPPRMRAALRRARWQGLPAENPGFHPCTIRALERRGLIHRRTSRKGKTTWQPTDTGRWLLVAPPVWLHERVWRNYTEDPRYAVHREPEAA